MAQAEINLRRTQIRSPVNGTRSPIEEISSHDKTDPDIVRILFPVISLI